MYHSKNVVWPCWGMVGVRAVVSTDKYLCLESLNRSVKMGIVTLCPHGTTNGLAKVELTVQIMNHQ